MSQTTEPRRAIAGIESGRLEIRPGLSNVLNAMSRIAPRLMVRQLARTTEPQTAEPRTPTGAPR